MAQRIVLDGETILKLADDVDIDALRQHINRVWTGEYIRIDPSMAFSTLPLADGRKVDVARRTLTTVMFDPVRPARGSPV